MGRVLYGEAVPVPVGVGLVVAHVVHRGNVQPPIPVFLWTLVLAHVVHAVHSHHLLRTFETLIHIHALILFPEAWIQIFKAFDQWVVSHVEQGGTAHDHGKLSILLPLLGLMLQLHHGRADIDLILGGLVFGIDGETCFPGVPVFGDSGFDDLLNLTLVELHELLDLVFVEQDSFASFIEIQFPSFRKMSRSLKLNDSAPTFEEFVEVASALKGASCFDEFSHEFEYSQRFFKAFWRHGSKNFRVQSHKNQEFEMLLGFPPAVELKGFVLLHFLCLVFIILEMNRFRIQANK